jgi:hypothetical protein
MATLGASNDRMRRVTTSSMLRRGIALAGLLMFAAGAQAQSPRLNSVDREIMSTSTFLSAHPDLRFRMLGLQAWEKGDYPAAMTAFRRGARYADKPSQGMVAEMLWNGQGTPVDRPLAHAWMQVAAEREFKVMVLNRDRYWAAMQPAERERASALAPVIAAEYGDSVAKPRLERKMRSARNNSTGSRTGATGNLRIILPSPHGDVTVDGSQFFDDRFWKPADYWAWQAADWKELPKGRVKVGPLEGSKPPAAAN